ncbi:MAG: porin family protein [Gammaproteobacteria bacterium]|nr:MAG: porin family protein [Gammaproteobacteria bacterium]
MFKKISVIVAVFGFVFATTSNAGDMGMYAGGSLASIDYEITEDGYEDEGLDMIVGSGMFGFSFNENFSVEGRLGFGLTDDEIGDVTFETEYFFSAFLRAAIPVDGGNIYGLIGVSNVKFKYSYPWFGDTYSESESESDVSFGIGAELPIYSKGMLGIEYIELIDKEIDGTNFDLSTVGIVFKHSF